MAAQVKDKTITLAPENGANVAIISTGEGRFMAKKGVEYVVSGKHANILIKKGFATLKK